MLAGVVADRSAGPCGGSCTGATYSWYELRASWVAHIMFDFEQEGTIHTSAIHTFLHRLRQAAAQAGHEGLMLVGAPGTKTGFKGVSPTSCGGFKVNVLGGRNFLTGRRSRGSWRGSPSENRG